MKVFDLHADTMMDITNSMAKGERDVLARKHLPAYKKGEVGGLIYALWVPTTFEIIREFMPEDDPLAAKEGTSQQIMMRMLAASFREFHETSAVKLCHDTKEMEAAEKEGRIPVILGIEGFYGFEGEPDMIDMMYHLGFRHGMLTWNDDNEFASGAEFTGTDKGLTEKGVAVIKRMEQLGMLIDVSHASEKTFWDIVKNSSSPLMASHSNAWSLCQVPRNLKDDQIKAMAERDGVIGMNGWLGFIEKDLKADVDSLAAHARYIADLVGHRHVGCGFDYADYLGENQLTPGLETAAETQGFIEALARQGFTDSQIEDIAWNNAHRVIKAVLG